VFNDFNFEVPRLAADGFDLGEGFQFDIQVPADLDQFR